MAITDLRFDLLRCGQDRVARAWSGERPADGDTRLYLPVTGSARIVEEGRTLVLRPGRWYLLPAWTARRYHCRESLELAFLHCRISLAATVDWCQVWHLRRTWPCPDPPLAAAQIAAMCSTVADLAPEQQLRQDADLRRLFAPGLERLRLQDDADHDWRILLPVLQAIDARLAGPLSIGELARLAGWSPAHFSRRFRHSIGETPWQHLSRRRIARARDLLADPDLSLERIAGLCGFHDAFHLSRRFRQLTGQSPSDWRRSFRDGNGP